MIYPSLAAFLSSRTKYWGLLEALLAYRIRDVIKAEKIEDIDANQRVRRWGRSIPSFSFVEWLNDEPEPTPDEAAARIRNRRQVSALTGRRSRRGDARTHTSPFEDLKITFTPTIVIDMQ